MAIKRVVKKYGSLAISPRDKGARLVAADTDKERKRMGEQMKKSWSKNAAAAQSQKN